MGEYKFLDNSSTDISSDVFLETADDHAISCNQATVGWQSSSSCPLLMKGDRKLLENVSFTVKNGQALAIVGQVGSTIKNFHKNIFKKKAIEFTAEHDPH